MSFPVESSRKVFSELDIHPEPGNDITNNFNNTHSLVASDIKDQPSSQPHHDIINSNQIDDTKNLPPGSSITSVHCPCLPNLNEFPVPTDDGVKAYLLVYKKCASNGSLAVYVGTRTLTVEGTHMEPLYGVLVLDKDSLEQNVSPNFRIWGQITLTFRYGREDEEVLGLRFCNEAILALKQLWPPLPNDVEFPEEDEPLTPLQMVLLERIHTSATSSSINSLAFTLSAGPVGLGSFPPPPSVLLAPAKPYKGSPIGTIYDLRIYASERPEERPPRRNLIRLALRAVQIPSPNLELESRCSVEARPTFLSRGKIKLACELDTNTVRYGEPLEVKIIVQNNSRSSIRRIIVSMIQQVDVCMFTSGKFKNVVGLVEDAILLVPGASCQKRYSMTAARGPARQWLALEEAFGRDPVLAPSTSLESIMANNEIAQKNSPNSRNVFAIIVSYYVKAKLILGGLSLCQNVKVPFVLLPPQISDDTDPYPSPKVKVSQGIIPEQREVESLRHTHQHQDSSSSRSNERAIEF